MKKASKAKSKTPIIITVGSFIASVAMVNPVPFIVGVLFVGLYGDKFGQRYNSRTERRIK